MARNTFGGSITAYVVTVQDASAQYGAGAQVLRVATSTAVSFWSAATGGTAYTDLLIGSTPVTSVVTDTLGNIPQFWGPDGVTVMWADAGAVRRILVCNEQAVSAATLGSGPPSAATFLAGDLVWRSAPTGTVGTLVPADPANTGQVGSSPQSAHEDHVHGFGATVDRIADAGGAAVFDISNGQIMTVNLSTGAVAITASTAVAPGPVTGLTATTPGTNGSKTVNLAWTAPTTGLPLTDYILQCIRVSDSVQMAVPNLTASSVSATITGLADATQYNIALAAINSVGTGPQSGALVTTDPATVVAAVPSPPLNLAAVTPGTSASKSMTFTWDPPASRNGTLVNYVASMTGTHGAIPTIGPAATTVTVTGLTDNTAYTFTLQAANATGSSTAVTVTKTSDPATVVAPKMLLGFNLPGSGGSSGAYLRDARDNSGGSETNAQMLARLVSTFGQVQTGKTFALNQSPGAAWPSGLGNGSNTPTWDPTNEGVNTTGKNVMIVYKTTWQDSVAGNYDAALRNYMASIPAGWTVYFQYINEPDNDIAEILPPPKGTGFFDTKAHYVAGANHYADVIREFRGRSPSPLNAGVNVWSATDHMYSFIRSGQWPMSNTSGDDRLPRKVDFQGLDIYLNPPPGDTGGGALNYIQNGLYEMPSYSAASIAANCKTLFGRVLDYNGVSYANRWFIPELGIPFRQQDVRVAGTNGSPTGTGRPDGSVRADTYTNACVQFRAAGCLGISFWNVTTGRFPHRILDLATSPALSRYNDGSAWWPPAGATPNPNREPAVAAIRAQFGL